ncbi:MAG: DegQ family serine endoprotease [Desulfobacterales bacterium]|nr:DegQ family serine endoprotease [Desulfobacterales bacterium]
MIPASFSQLAESVSPAVVNIRTVKTLKGGGPVLRHFQREPFGREQPFQDFFERFFGEEMQREFKQPSLGSGFIIDREGHVVTNNHVIEDADQIKVKLGDEKEFDAQVVGRDPSTDLALLKIKAAQDLPVVKLGDSAQLKIGQWVVAIGSPFGLERTVTAGIVSAKGRVIGSGPYDDFIQTDASINPGNSGGPLINMKGEVVGINTAIVASGQGIGFAIPIDLAKGIIAQLKSGGEVTRGWLGVAIQDVSPEMADYYGVEAKKGVFVADVFKGDPAEAAGIRPKDIIVEVNGQKVETTRQLTSLVANIPVGQAVKVKVLREGQPKTFQVKIAKRDDTKTAARGEPPEKRGEDPLGLKVSALTPEIAQRFAIGETAGVIVTDVQNGTPAEEAGVRAGDLIKEINHTPVESVADYRAALKKFDKEKTLQLFVWRKNAGFLVLKLTK